MVVLDEGTYARILDSYYSRSYATAPAKPAPAKSGCNLPAADQDCCDVPGAGVPVIGFLAQHICSGGKSVSKGVNAIGSSVSKAGESASKGGQALGNLGAGLGNASNSLQKFGIPGGLATPIIIIAIGIGAFFLLKKL